MGTLSRSSVETFKGTPRLPAARGALTVACPLCDARPRQQCWAMSTGPKGGPVRVTAATTKHRHRPHPERCAAARDLTNVAKEA